MTQSRTEFHHDFEASIPNDPENGVGSYQATYTISQGRPAGRVTPAEHPEAEIIAINRTDGADPYISDEDFEILAEGLDDQVLFEAANSSMVDMAADAADARRDEIELGGF